MTASRGYIVPVGGAEEKMGDVAILRRFATLCGGPGCRIAIIPTASMQSETGSRYEELFHGLGVREARALPIATREDGEHPEWLEVLDQVDGVFLAGGNQLRLSTTIGGTQVAKALRRRNREGMHVAGTSAGAAFLCEHMIAFGKEGASPRAKIVTLAPGLGLTNRVIIDQHFRQRDRLGRLLTALAYNPFAIGIGLDENTAAFIGPDETLEVVGGGALTIVDPSGLEFSSMARVRKNDVVCLIGLKLHILDQGSTFNLHTRIAAAAPAGHYHVIYQYEQQDVGLEAGQLALTLLHSLLPSELRPEGSVPQGFDFAAVRDEFIHFTQRRALGPSTVALVRAAEERRIPWIRLNDQSLIQFGHGRYQQRIQATVTSRTSHIAVELASDKEETNRLLGNLGLPVPQQRLVQQADDAVAAAERIGYPVVVKPYNANHGRGISIHLTDADQVRTAFDVAREHSRSVIVESFITGEDHRMLVIDGELVAVAKRVPGHVVGDGIHTIEQLVDEVNQDPRRGVGHEKVLTRLVFDHQAETLLAAKGYTRQTVPASGEQVFLRSTGNLSTGGTAIDMTDLVHPDNIEMAVRAVKAIGLDVGGVDFLSTDITESYKEVGGAICEVNAAPGFRMHMAPSEGLPRDVGGRALDMLFPPGTPSRIPIAAITGTNGKTTTARILAHIQKLAGHHVGLTSTDGVYIDGQRTVPGDMTGPVATRMVLSDPSVDVAVLEIARGGLLRAGMGVRHCDVGAVLNVKADHLGLRGIGTLEQLAEVKRIVVEIARDTAILNADDPLCLKMADYTEAKHLCYVTMNPTHELVGEHIQAGGRGVVLESGIKGQMITIYDHGAHIPLLWTHLIPATLEGRAMHNVQNAMFAAAMAFSMGLKLEDIRHGLRTFDTTFFQAPGRMNIYDEHSFKVILDYGHNPTAIQAMCDLVDRLEVTGRRLVVLAGPGDRRDEDILEIGRIAAGRFARYICRRDDQLRGRRSDEVPNLLREALLASGVPADQILVIPEETAAVDTALREAEPGDLLLIFGDAITRSWKQVIQFRPDATPRMDERSRISRPEPVAAVAVPVLEDRRREFVRDSRGVRLAREEHDD